MQELMNHIKSLNEKTRKWVNQGEGRWATLHVEDPEYWEEQGITTVEQFERDELINYIWDAYKDAYGFSPSASLEDMSIDELKEMAERIRLKECAGV